MDQQLGLQISDAARLLRLRFDERARLVGSTRAQWRALSAIRRSEGINQGSLAMALDVEAITACRMVDRLEESGLVERRPDPRDRRAWQIFLTPKAAPVIEQAEEVARQLIAEMLDGLDAEEQARLSRSLDKIRSNLTGPVAQHTEAADG